VRELFEVQIEDFFDLADRGGVAIVGVHSGGVINSGDSALLRLNERDVPVAQVVVEMHARPGKIALFLPGLDRADVELGAKLIGPSDA
jgi:hypothetical protein